MTKKHLTNYQQSTLKQKLSLPLNHKDYSGKRSHSLRAALVGNRTSTAIHEAVKTTIFPLDATPEKLQEISLDKLSKLNFVLNGCAPGSLINAVLNFQVQGWSLFDNSTFANNAADMAATTPSGGAVAKTRNAVVDFIIEDATLAGMLVISQYMRDPVWKRIALKDVDKAYDSVAVSNRNALSWLLNTDGISLMHSLSPSIDIDVLSKAPEYRSHIEGKLSSWSSNYKSSLKTIEDQATKAVTKFENESFDKSILNKTALENLSKILVVYRKIVSLITTAQGLSTTPLTYDQAKELLQLTDVDFYQLKKEYEQAVRDSLWAFKVSLKENKLSNKEVIQKMNEVKSKYYIPKLAKIKKIGGPSRNILEAVTLKQAELAEKLHSFNTLVSNTLSINISKVPASAPEKIEQRSRRQLDDLGRVAFGNRFLATMVYPLISDALGHNGAKENFLNWFLFGQPVKGPGVKKLQVPTQKGKLAYSHTEQDIEPYSPFLITDHEAERNTLNKLVKLANKFEKSVAKRLLKVSKAEQNAVYSTMWLLKLRVLSWTLSIVADGISEGVVTDNLGVTEDFVKNARIEAGRLVVDLQNLMADLNPVTGKIAYSLSIPDAIGEGAESLKLQLKSKNWTPPIALNCDHLKVSSEFSYEEWAKVFMPKYEGISKEAIYHLNAFEEKENEPEDKRAKRFKTYENKLKALMTADQKQIVDLAWKVPHDIMGALPPVLVECKAWFRIKGTTAQKTPLSKTIARREKISDGLYVFNVEVVPALTWNADLKSIEFVSDPKITLTGVTHNLPMADKIAILPHRAEIQEKHKHLLAIDLNANGLGVSLFEHVSIDAKKSKFKRVELTQFDNNGVLSYRLPDGRPFKVFHTIKGLADLKNRVGLYRKLAQKQRKFGAFIDPVLEKFRKTVVADICKTIESLMVEHNVQYLAFENEVSNLETGAAQLRTLYKSIINLYAWPENDARRSLKKGYWQGEKSLELIGAEGEKLKFHPGQTVLAAGTSQICSECGVNPLTQIFDKPEVRLTEIRLGSLAYLVFSTDKNSLKIPVDANDFGYNRDKLFADVIKDPKAYASLLDKPLTEESRRKLRNKFKTNFMRTDLNKGLSVGKENARSKQSKYVCYNPDCKCYLVARDADYNAANNIGQRLIDKLGRKKDYFNIFWDYLESRYSIEFVKDVSRRIKPVANKVGVQDGHRVFFNTKLDLVFGESDDFKDFIENALVECGVNGDTKTVSVSIAVN